MSYEKVNYSLIGSVARIAMNDPATRNAGSAQMGEELVDAFNRAAGEARPYPCRSAHGPAAPCIARPRVRRAGAG